MTNVTSLSETLIFRILLIDDDPDDALLTRSLLQESAASSFRVSTTSDVQEALRAMTTNAYDAFLLDYRLGVKDGITLLKEAIAAGCLRPVIMLTGQSEIETAHEALHAGAVDYVPKSAMTAAGLERTIRYSIERARIRMELLQTSERLRLALNAGQCGAWDWNIPTNRVEWTERLYELHGIAPGQFGGTLEAFTELVHPEDLSRVRSDLEHALRTGGHFQTEFRSIRPDGKTIWVNTHGQAYYEGGQPVRMVGITMDTTERRSREQALAESEERLRFAVGSPELTVYMQDLDLRYTWLYRGSADMSYGLGKTDQELLGNEDGEHLTALKRQALQNRSRMRHVVKVLQNGVESFYDLIIEPRFDAEGNLLGVGGAAVDVTERTRAELALKQKRAEERLFEERLAQLHRLSSELARAEHMEHLMQLAVEGGVKRLGFGRLSIWVKEGEGQVQGTWGIDEKGELRDERNLTLPVEPGSPLAAILNGDTKLVLQPKAPLYDDRSKPVGMGWHVQLALRDNTGIYGCLNIDNFVGSANFSDSDREILTLFAYSLGNSVAIQRAMEKLRASERLYRAVGDSIDYGVWLADSAGSNSYASPSFHRLIGMSEQQASGFGWMEAFKDAAGIRAAWHRGVASGEPFSMELQTGSSTTAAGSLLVRAVPVRGETGEIVNWVGINLDISDLKEIEQKLRESEQNFRLALSQSSITVFSHDSELRYTWMYNGPSSRDISEILGKTDLEFGSIEGEFNYSQKKKVLDTGKGVRYEVSAQLDRKRHYDIMVEPLRNQAGAIVGVAGAAADITERKEHEENIRALNQSLEARVYERTAELELANQELKLISYSIAHDMRTSLRSLVIRSFMLRERLGPLVDEQTQTDLAQLELFAKQATSLANGLLDFARLGQRTVEPSQIDLSALAESVGEDLPYCKGPDASAELAIQPGLVDCADPSLMRTVLTNLIDNACRYGQGPRKVRVEFGADEIEGERRYFVKDDGPGFEMLYADRLFEPFERLHRDADVPGSGMGLASARRIIERHNGRIWAESAPGEGATFWFTLHASQPGASQAGSGEYQQPAEHATGAAKD